jgi:hypothetical protein
MTLSDEIWNIKTNVFISGDSKVTHYILGILNSKLIDFCFRLFNSNTQASSTELNHLYNLTLKEARGIEPKFPLSKAEYEGMAAS